MKYAVAALALAAAAGAQSISDLPQCARSCLVEAIAGSGCDIDDLNCTCNVQDVDRGASECFQDSCNVAELTEAATLIVSVCLPFLSTQSFTLPVETTRPIFTSTGDVESTTVTVTSTPVSDTASETTTSTETETETVTQTETESETTSGAEATTISTTIIDTITDGEGQVSTRTTTAPLSTSTEDEEDSGAAHVGYGGALAMLVAAALAL